MESIDMKLLRVQKLAKIAIRMYVVSIECV